MILINLGQREEGRKGALMELYSIEFKNKIDKNFTIIQNTASLLKQYVQANQVISVKAYHL
jgi:hypothetical protein